MDNAPLSIHLVKGLTQPISELVPFLPCYAETRLLPFRGQIVTDGLIAPIIIHLSARMAKGFLTEARELIATHGLITTLPPTAKSGDTDADLLKFYLSTAAHRRDYCT